MSKVYILFSKNLNRYYVGQTENLEGRLKFHNDNFRNHIWTSRGIPWELKVSFTCDSRGAAMQLEKYLKNLKSRTLIEKMISEGTIILNGKTITSDPD